MEDSELPDQLSKPSILTCATTILVGLLSVLDHIYDCMRMWMCAPMSEVDTGRKATKKQMEWLKNGGRDRIERMAKKSMKDWEKAGHEGDFSLLITLASDILLIARRKGAVAYSVWKFNYDEIKRVQKMYKDIKE